MLELITAIIWIVGAIIYWPKAWKEIRETRKFLREMEASRKERCV